MRNPEPCSYNHVSVEWRWFLKRFIGMFLFDLGFFSMGCAFFWVCFVAVFGLFFGGEGEEGGAQRVYFCILKGNVLV